MYRPTHFDVTESEAITRFIRANAFGQILSSVDGRLTGSYLPLLYDAEARTLTGHLARANPHAAACDGADVLVALEGAHGYVSPSWYEKSGGVPTWNYQAVHIAGAASCFSDPARLAQLVNDLSAVYERHETAPWVPDYPQGMLSAIVGIEIAIDSIEAKFKLSQNRSAKDVELVCAALEARGEHALVAAMREAIRER